MALVTVRIPELTSQSTLSLSDKIAVWVAADNKTRHASLTDLRTLMTTGGGASYVPVYLGGSVIYTVPADAAGGKIASIPSLAGKDFLLRLEGRAMEPGTEYEILNAGGFKLPDDPADNVLIEGQRFELDVFSLQGGAPAPSSSGGGSLITGVVPVTTNLTLNPSDHLNKLIQLRAGSSQITVTLPDVDDVPDNTIVPIEASILNTFQNKIQTQGGQFIYIRNQSVTYLYVAKGETLWLYRGDDGWYDLNGFGEILNRVGKIETSYKVGFNELVCDGSLLTRSAHPRLWEWVLTLGDSLVSDTTWNTASVVIGSRTVLRPYRGCFSTGDGTTTFRLPDLMNVALRGIKSLSGTDTERYLNQPGGFQRNEIEAHDHDIDYVLNGTDGVQNGKMIPGTSNGESTPSTGTDTTAIKTFGGTETRMDNVGVIWTIKE